MSTSDYLVQPGRPPEEIPLLTWDDFLAELGALDDFRARREEESSLTVSPFLYRGQPDAAWNLESTLERTLVGEVSLSKYHRAIRGCRYELEAFTGKQWDIPTLTAFEELVRGTGSRGFRGDPRGMQTLEYMVHLRHHGFPSPLLDWTVSPYIAAFFAFQEAREDVERVAVYAYMGQAGAGRGGWVNEPTVHNLGRTIRTHQRHFRQRSEYTFATRRDGDDVPAYCAHESAFAPRRDDQDLLWKFVMPISERRRVLEFLDQFNLNAYTLFGSEESLLETLANREFLFD